MRPLVIAAVALLAVGIANIDVHPTEVKVVHDRAPVKVVEKVRTKVVRVSEKVRQPDGYVSRDNCLTIASGTPFRDVIFRYGWPAADNAEDSYAGYLIYPLTEDHNVNCIVDFYRGKVEKAELS